jgi:hypothetical protein
MRGTVRTSGFWKSVIAIAVDPRTALHHACIVWWLRRTPGCETHPFRSIVVFPKRLERCRKWRFVLKCHDDLDREAGAPVLSGQPRSY